LKGISEFYNLPIPKFKIEHYLILPTMAKYFIGIVFLCILVPAFSQEKFASIDPSGVFLSADRTVTYYNKYENNFRINLQNGKDFTRLLYDSSFKLTDSFSFSTKDITFNYNHINRAYFLTAASIESGNYEVYSDGNKVFLLQPDFKGKTDRTVYEHLIAQTEKDERLLAVFPGKAEIRILSASYKTDKLFLYTWTPGNPVVKTDFDLPESNITDEKQKKEIPKEGRIRFSRDLTSVVVQPIKETVLYSRRSPYLYYSDDFAYIVVPMPYYLGEYLIELNLKTYQYKGTNYIVNSLKDNASTKVAWHKVTSAAMYDSLLVIKNASERIYEYYFYDIKTGRELKKYSSSPDDLKYLIHSDMKQKGTWVAENGEKDLDNYKKFLRKGSQGMVLVSGVSPDSLTLTSLALVGTTGIAGAFLDLAVGMQLAALGLPTYWSATPALDLVTERNKIIFAHSRFSTNGLSPSGSTGVVTMLDKLLDGGSKSAYSNSSFLVKKKGTYFLGYYSKDTKKIEIVKYYGDY
jgi:hypothetical protein